MFPEVVRPPHCFGSATSFNLNVGSRCHSCPEKLRCGSIAVTSMGILKQHIEIGDIYANLLVQFSTLVPNVTVKAGDYKVKFRGEEPKRSVGRLKRRDLTATELRLLDTMPVKVAKRMRPLMRAGIFAQLKERFQTGENPFPTDENHFLHMFASRLLADGKVKKSEAGALFANQYGWTPATAASHVSVAVSVFMVLGLTTDRGDSLEVAI